MKKVKALVLALLLGGTIFLASACDSDADIAARNLSYAAEQFEVPRRIIFYNGITDTVMFVIEGRCSVETANSALTNALEVTCKVGPDAFHKEFLGLSDNTTFMVQQLENVDVSTYQYKVLIKPDQIVPSFDFESQVIK